MPFEFICKNCLKQGVKTVLYYDESPKIYGMIGYGENSSYLGKIAKLVKACPRCGHKPEFPPETIEVYPIKNNKEKQA